MDQSAEKQDGAPVTSGGNCATPSTKRKIIVCCDGTWNSEKFSTPLTNVSMISRCIEQSDEMGNPQIVYYQDGVGTGTSGPGNVVEGVTGRGLYENIRSAYSFICHNYTSEQDQIFLIGFSRGAFTARCIAQFICNIGILTKEGMVLLLQLFSAWKSMMKRNMKGNTTSGDEFERAIFKEAKLEQTPKQLEQRNLLRRNVKIKACAVWDTVSSFGLPVPGIVSQPAPRRLKLVNSELCPNIENAFQALALHEHRRPFRPIPWLSPKDSNYGEPQVLKQCWFNAYHGHVGGGSKDDSHQLLARLPLVWMMAQLQPHLRFNISNLWTLLHSVNFVKRKEKARGSQKADVGRDGVELALNIPGSEHADLGVWSISSSIRRFAEQRTSTQDSEPSDPVMKLSKQSLKNSTAKVKNSMKDMRDSMQHIYLLTGSKYRRPYCQYLSSDKFYKVTNPVPPSVKHPPEAIHFSVRILSEVIIPCFSLKDTRPQGADTGGIWWEIPESKSYARYTIKEDRVSEDEVRWLQKWLAVERDRAERNKDPAAEGSNSIINTLLRHLGSLPESTPRTIE